MKYLPGIFLVIIFTKELSAQSSKSNTLKPYTQAVRFNVLGLVDPFDGNISFGGEYAFHPRLSVTTDLSFILYSTYLQNNKRALGYILKPAIRYYASENRSAFLEAAIFYKGVGYKTEGWIDNEVVNGLPTYQEYKEFIFRKRVIGINLQAGFQRSISKDKLLLIEGYFGFGIRFKWQDIKDNPNSRIQSDNIFFDPLSDPYYVRPSIPTGLRLVYVIE